MARKQHKFKPPRKKIRKYGKVQTRELSEEGLASCPKVIDKIVECPECGQLGLLSRMRVHHTPCPRWRKAKIFLGLGAVALVVITILVV